MNILSSRKSSFTKVTDSLSFDLIYSIPDDAVLQGGVKDIGKFSEGYCFQVVTKTTAKFFEMTEKNPIPAKGSNKTWYICSDKEEQKTKLMNLIIKLRLKKQHKVGLYLNKNQPQKELTIENLITTENPDKKNLTPLDGYWVLLQDWSSCSVKCGGGVQYQHLMCVPPKNGGKACIGKALREKPCNPQPCPSVGEAEKILLREGEEKVNKPIIKTMAISSRPLRYDKCHIKEGDALFTRYEKGVGINDNPNKTPARIVMNDKTITVYTDENLATQIDTFILEKTKFQRPEGNPHCFRLESPTTKGEFCNLDSNPKVNFIEEWQYDFNLFKVQCHSERKVIALNDKEEKQLQHELEKKIDAAKLEVIKERTRQIQSKIHESPVNKIDKLQETAMLAMKKELSIDGLLQKEELEREEAETRELKIQLETEKKKDECLMKSIKEKEMEDQFNMNKVQQEKEMNELKEQAKQQILLKRKQVKMRILQMRKRAERRKKLYQDQIQSLRIQVAGELNKVSKEGNMDFCFKPSNSDEDKKKVLKYCKNSFMDASPVKFNECLAEESYCFVCCENEYGNMHIKKREVCYDKCEEVPKKNENSGAWQWVESIH